MAGTFISFDIPYSTILDQVWKSMLIKAEIFFYAYSLHLPFPVNKDILFNCFGGNAAFGLPALSLLFKGLSAQVMFFLFFFIK